MKGLINELQFLTDELKQSKEENHILKINQQQDGSMNFSVYAGDNLLYESSGHYKMDYSDFRHETSCKNNHCDDTIEYNLIEDEAFSNKIRVEEKYYHDSPDHFNMNLAFYDESGNVVGKYGTELSFQSFQYDQDDQGPQEVFVIHDLSAI